MLSILVVDNKHNTARVASCWFIIYYRHLNYLQVYKVNTCRWQAWGMLIRCPKGLLNTKFETSWKFDCISAGVGWVLLFVEEDSWCQQQSSTSTEQEAAVTASHPQHTQYKGWSTKGGRCQLTSRYLQDYFACGLFCRKKLFPCNWNHSGG